MAILAGTTPLHWSGDGNNPASTPLSSIPGTTPKPQSFKLLYISKGRIRSPICAIPTFEDFTTISPKDKDPQLLLPDSEIDPSATLIL